MSQQKSRIRRRTLVDIELEAGSDSDGIGDD